MKNIRINEDKFELNTAFMSNFEKLFKIEPTAVINSGTVRETKKTEKSVASKEFSFDYLRSRRLFMLNYLTEMDIHSKLNEKEIKESLEKPKHCSLTCENGCEKIQKFGLNSIESTRINAEMIKDELHEHGHPKSRKKKNGKWRTVTEAREELRLHYLYAHAKNLRR